MQRLAIAIFVSILCTTSHAQKVYKCGNTFSQTPCSNEATLLDVRPSSGRSATVATDAPIEASQSAPSRAEQMQSSIAESQRKRRLLDLEIYIPNQRRSIANHQQRCRERIAAVRSQKNFAANNLAGATWEQSISTEMQSIATQCDTEQRTMNLELERLIQEQQQLQKQ